MSLSQRAQTVLEYLIIATIIMAGIVIGGPFLAKAVGAHFRLMEDSAIDSVGEDIRQAPRTPPPGGACKCDPWTPGGCGNNDPCTPSQKVYTRNCLPDGCDTVKECRSAPNCCKDPVIEHCGTILPGHGCPDPRPLPKATLSDGSQVDVFDAGTYTGICPDASPPPPDCKVWERLYSITCGVYSPTNPSASTKYYACKDVKFETEGPDLVNCGPVCWDASSADGSPFTDPKTGAVASPCPADETSADNLPEEIYARGHGTVYVGDGNTYLDAPRRDVVTRPPLPTLKMYEAYQVINTYFDPAIANLDPYANQCAPGQANYGLASCHRCHPLAYSPDDPTRRCEFICPPGLYPMSLGGFANATCKPCSPGETQISIAYNRCGSCNWAIQYVPPPVSGRTDYYMKILGTFQNFVLTCVQDNGTISSEFSNNCGNCCNSSCWNTPNFGGSGKCFDNWNAAYKRGNPCAVKYSDDLMFEADLYGNRYFTMYTGDTRNSHGDHPWNGEFRCSDGNAAVMTAAHTSRCDSGCNTNDQRFVAHYPNPDYLICSENTIDVTMTASINASVRVNGGSPAALIAHIENDAANAPTNSVSFKIAKDTGGQTLVELSNKSGDRASFFDSYTGSSPAIPFGVSLVTLTPSTGTCVVVSDGSPCTNISLTPEEVKVLKFTY